MNKNDITLLATLIGLTGTAVYLLSRAHPAITADSLVGFAVVATLLAVAQLEYRVIWKNLLRR